MNECKICKKLFHVIPSHILLRKTCSKTCDAVNRSKFMPAPNKGIHIDPKIRFFAKVKKTESCWLWTGAKFTNGYGVFCSYPKKNLKAHRFSYELHKGKIPPDKFVCHSCDIKLCVNPDHLWLGTQKENIRDSMAKNRHSCQHR